MSAHHHSHDHYSASSSFFGRISQMNWSTRGFLSTRVQYLPRTAASMMYSQAVSTGLPPPPPPPPARQPQPQPKPSTTNQGQKALHTNSHPKSPSRANKNNHQQSDSSWQTPRTASAESSSYVLTLLTDSKHHATMTAMRKRYFPARLNRLEAHITLFHALPGSKLDEVVIPTLREVSETSAPFSLLAAKPFRLGKGIAIAVSKAEGGDEAKQIHRRLQDAWKGFLSEQDARGLAAHYTIMNKVDDPKAVQQAFAEVEEQWRPCPGTVRGLSLFRYDRGNWSHQEDFVFKVEGQ